MWFAHAGITDGPRHARVEPRRRRRYGGLVALALYVGAFGLNEWRLQRHVESIRARADVPAMVELPLDSDSAVPATTGNGEASP
jgi:hypothetical protein